MELILIGLVALLTSGLTLFSGFGLGTILRPVFALFFPAPLAIATTAVVHFANRNAPDLSAVRELSPGVPCLSWNRLL